MSEAVYIPTEKALHMFYEAYWRETIAKEIMTIDLSDGKEISSDWYASALRTRTVCATIAKVGLGSL